ncbi:MaoC/PaaZ C-terminal domain-containing protein [Streptomyces cavernae]|uniref:MaoC/PaaZ C-terminal domain-containing protein n=1 Tax=Streptomyces cavernae TaxID=2259034 RepID=UPI000FEB8BDE|nr:MaoC/PaaZ C-terminal domain-containing protein [Streptomyces cavernae]
MTESDAGFTEATRGRSVTLAAPPRLGPLLARGALWSPFKRARPDARNAPVPATRIVLPEVRVDVQRLTSYERVCGFGVGAVDLPVTYPHVLAFPLAMRIMADRTFPLPLLGLVHTSIEIRQLRGLSVAEAYELAAHVDGFAPHRRGTEARLVVEVRCGGDLVWESCSTYLARHRTSRDTASAPSGAEGVQAPPSHPRLPARSEWRLAGDLGRRYARASGDHNPIHLHPVTASPFGFSRPIAHGMWTVARCLAEFGAEGQGAVRVRADFKAPVPLPGAVVYAADGPAFELRGASRVHLTGTVTPRR